MTNSSPQNPDQPTSPDQPSQSEVTISRLDQERVQVEFKIEDLANKLFSGGTQLPPPPAELCAGCGGCGTCGLS